MFLKKKWYLANAVKKARLMKHIILLLSFICGFAITVWGQKASQNTPLVHHEGRALTDTFDFYFDPQAGLLQITFSEWQSDCGGDFLYVLEGTKLVSVYGCQSPNRITSQPTNTGMLRLVFVEDAINSGGKMVFQAEIIPLPVPKPFSFKRKEDIRPMADGCARCDNSITASGDNIMLCNGGCTYLNADAKLFTTINDNFNSGTLNTALWDFSNGQVTQGCGSPDGTPTMWFGSGVPERFASTKGINTTGACNLGFMFKFGTEENASDNGCEDADESAENVQLQYFNGTTWITFQILDNNGLIPNGPYDNWTRVCVDLPVEARSADAKFRWYQGAHSGFGFDQWAIDDVSIDVSLPVRYRWQGPNFLGNGSDTLQRPPVCPTQTSTYTVTAFNGNTSISTTVTVEVIDATALGGAVVGDPNQPFTCEGQRPPVLTLTGYQGNILSWQYSTGCTGNYLPIVNTAPNYAPEPITQTTCYRALVQFGPCNDVSDSIKITVPSSDPGVITIDKTVVCMGEVVTYTIVGGMGEVVEWQFDRAGSNQFDNIYPSTDRSITVNANDFNCFRAMVRFPGCPDTTAVPTPATCLDEVITPIMRGITPLEPWYECGDSINGITSFNILPQNVIRWEKKNDQGQWTPLPNTENQTTVIFPENIKNGDCFRIITDLGPEDCGIPPTELCISPTPCNQSCGLTQRKYCKGQVINDVIAVVGDNMDSCKKIVRFEIAENPDNHDCDHPSLQYEIQPDSLTQDSLMLFIRNRPFPNPLCIRALAVQSYNPQSFAYLYYTTVDMQPPPTQIQALTATPNKVCAGNNNGLVAIGGYDSFLEIVRWEMKPSIKDTAWTPIMTTSSNVVFTNLTQSTSYRILFKDKDVLYPCPYYSDTVMVEVTPGSVAGILKGGKNVCPDSTATWLNLEGYVGEPVRWETSLDNCNGPWNLFTTSPITDYFTRRLTRTTCYRVVVKSGNCPEATSTTALVQIVPPPLGGEIAGSGVVCVGLPGPRLSVVNYTGSVVRWESSLDCSNFTNPTTIANTNTFYDVPALQQNTCFRAVVSNGGCDAKSQFGTVSVVAQTLPGKLSGRNRVCFGDNSTIQLSESTGDIVRWERKPNSSQNWTSINHTLNQYNTGPLFETTCYRVYVKSPACPESATLPFCVTVDSLPKGGTLTPDTTVCVGQPAGNIKLINYRGGVIQWERSVGCTGNWSVIPNSGFPQFNPGVINQNTCFRVMVEVTGCGTAYSDVHEIKVAQPTVGGNLTPPATICSGANGGLLSLAGHLGTVKGWEMKAGNGNWQTIPNTQNRTSLISPTLTETTHFRVKVQNMSCPEAYSSEIVITVVTPQPVGTLAPAQSVCESSPGTVITLTGNTGNILRWEQAIDCNGAWTTINNTTNTLATGVLNRTICYRAVVNGVVCPEAFTAPLKMDVEPRPQGGILIGTKEVCDTNTTVTFRLTGYSGTIAHWQQSPDNTIWTDVNHTADTLQVTVNQSTYYRVVVGRGICPITYSDTAMVKVGVTPEGGQITPDQTICLGQGMNTIQVVNFRGNVLGWEASKNEGQTWHPLGKAGFTSYPGGALTITTWFRAIIGNGSCPTVYSEPVKITVNRPAQRGYLLGGGTFCEMEAIPTLTLAGYQGHIEQWEESADNGLNWKVLNHTQPTYTPTPFTGTKTYRVKIGRGGCASVYSVSTTVQMATRTVGGQVLPHSTICLGMKSPRFTLQNYNGEVIRWEASKDTGRTWHNLGKRGFNWYRADAVTITTWFRAIVQNGSCGIETSEPVKVTVIRQPIQSNAGGYITGDDSVCTGQMINLTLHDYRSPISHWEYTDGAWVDAIRIDDGSPSVSVVQFTPVSRKYRAVVVNPCGSAYSKEFTVVSLPSPNITTTVKSTCDAGGSIRAVSDDPNTLFQLIPPVRPANRTGLFENLAFGNYEIKGSNGTGCETVIPVAVNPTLPDPPLITRVENLTPTASRAHWTKVPGTTITYLFRYRKRNENTWTVHTGIRDTFRLIQPLESTTYYEIQVAAICYGINPRGDTTAWSDGIIKGFTSGGQELKCPDQPQVRPPYPTGLYVDEITPSTVKAHWNRVLGPGYIISYGKSDQNSNNWTQWAICNPDTFVVLNNLQPNAEYRVRVRTNCSNCITALNITDRRSDWSPRVDFRTPANRWEAEPMNSPMAIKLYPNPAREQVTLEYQAGEMIRLEVYDLKGVLVYSTDLTGKTHALEVSKWNKGIYLCKFTDYQGSIQTQKLVVE